MEGCLFEHKLELCRYGNEVSSRRREKNLIYIVHATLCLRLEWWIRCQYDVEPSYFGPPRRGGSFCGIVISGFVRWKLYIVDDDSHIRNTHITNRGECLWMTVGTGFEHKSIYSVPLITDRQRCSKVHLTHVTYILSLIFTTELRWNSLAFR